MSHRKHHRKYDKDITELKREKESRKQRGHKHRKKDIFDLKVNNKGKSTCGTQLVNSRMVTECMSKLVLERKRTGLIAVRIPVVITEVVVNVNLENTIEFTRNIVNLIRVKRRVVLKQCKLIAEANKLFFSGVVIKSIDYSEEITHSKSNLNGRAKNITISIPFQCVTRVEYINNPEIDKDKSEETKVFKMINGEQTFVDSYKEIDEVYCEVVKVSFNELNINGCNNEIFGKKHVHSFRKLKQKMVMRLTLRLLQKQTIHVKTY